MYIYFIKTNIYWWLRLVTHSCIINFWLWTKTRKTAFLLLFSKSSFIFRKCQLVIRNSKVTVHRYTISAPRTIDWCFYTWDVSMWQMKYKNLDSTLHICHNVPVKILRAPYILRSVEGWRHLQTSAESLHVMFCFCSLMFSLCPVEFP